MAKKRDVETLVQISRRVGRDEKLVQAGGGNTSVKSPDGRLMHVKASGTRLAEMTRNRGYVTLDVPGLIAVIKDRRLMRLPPARREQEVLKRLLALRVGGQADARPSVEAELHAILGRCVIHSHPIAANGLLCAKKSGQAVRLLRHVCPGEPLYVPYTDPGHPLAVKLYRQTRQYENRHGKMPSVILIENHGIFVSADTAQNALRITDRLVRRCDALLRKRGPRAAKKGRQRPVSDEALSENLLALRRAWTHSAGIRPVVEVVRHEPTARLLARPDGRKLLEPPLVPETIAYCGASALTLSPGAGIEGSIADFTRRFGAPPRVVLLPGVGFVALAATAGQTDAIETVFATHVETVERSLAFGGPRPLSPRANRYIAEWEVERYRRELAGGADGRQPLLNRVALVTGAGGCLGRAIAVGLACAGGRVTIVDINREEAEETARLVEKQAGPGRALVTLCDVTSEDALADAVRKTVLAFGGLDIVVAGAAIAPTYPLIDFPVHEWRRALELNLTGYFLTAREAVKAMVRQGLGGSVILLSSKSGLEASKDHSVYNATKAGEIHLMRGWALELGKYGIRVNAVAPGNVFKGSKIWNPAYIRARAKKRGIKPEEVIPYYISLTALGIDIEPEDVAGVVTFLASDAARTITGQTVVCDAGQVFVR